MMKTFLLTLLSLIAFAANSIICRSALGQHYIDPASFTIIRLLSGCITLYCILFFYQRFINDEQSTQDKNKLTSSALSKGSWLGSILLFLYAITFSYGYDYVDTGTGALILFGSVQISMIISTLMMKKTLLNIEWLGFSLAVFGFIYLIYPDLTTPSLAGFILMMFSGVAWAGYTLLGKNSAAPLRDTCYNFFRTIPFVLLLTFLTIDNSQYSYNGILLAVLSGAVMSGAGYAIWYSALHGLTRTKAAVVQLLVPVIATIGGVIFMAEEVTTRLQISTITVLGGVFVVLLSKQLLSIKNSRV